LLASRRGYNKPGAVTANCLVILNTKMVGFMVSKKLTYVLDWKMKKSYLTRAIAHAFLLLTGAIVPVSVIASDSLPYYESADFTPKWIAPDSAELEDFHRIKAFSFVNQDGKEITEQHFAQHIYVANFFFTTCPGICPMIRSKLSKVQEKFIDDDTINIVSHSIRPTTDTISMLHDYAKKNGIVSGKWHLLTGDKDTIYNLARTAYFANEDLGNLQNTNDFLHTENVLLIDKNRHIRGIYNGLNTSSINHLIADIAVLKNERAESKQGF
jgi:protein SCO1/2